MTRPFVLVVDADVDVEVEVEVDTFPPVECMWPGESSSPDVMDAVDMRFEMARLSLSRPSSATRHQLAISNL